MVTIHGFFLRVVTMFLIISGTYTEESINNNNGWIPITYQEAHNDAHRSTTNIQQNTQFPAFWNPIERKDNVENVRENINFKSYEINSGLMKDHPAKFEVSDKEDPYYLLKNRHQEIKTITDNFSGQKYVSMDKLTDTIKRKPKKIQEDVLYDNMINENLDEIITEKGTTIETNVNNQINTYEVTETSEATEVKNVLDQGKRYNKPSYFEPSFKSTTEENLTNKLFNVLGNYNIKINDDLTNYAVSRNKYNSKLAKISGRPPLKYNSQNYYPIDPLLAIFLSNYGYYLPGFFGFPANYHNIYGYLAANNIHNNKPFGAYKIYSDTDSSH